MDTPWGESTSTRQITEGITFYQTPEHGGYHISPTLLSQMPIGLRNTNYEGWFEEDREWAKVVYFFPQYFTAEERLRTLRIIKDNWPDIEII